MPLRLLFCTRCAAPAPAPGRRAVADGASAHALAKVAEREPAGLLVDSPWPPPGAPRWRRRLFHALHSPAHHAVLLALISATICLNLAALMLSLFFCRQLHEQRAPAVARALRALRWTSVGLLFVMLAEAALRCAVVSVRAFFAQPIHLLDVGVLLSVLVVELAVSEQAAREAAALLIIVRLLRLTRLLFSINNLAAARHETLAERVAHLEAALCAAERGAGLPRDDSSHAQREQETPAARA